MTVKKLIELLQEEDPDIEAVMYVEGEIGPEPIETVERSTYRIDVTPDTKKGYRSLRSRYEVHPAILLGPWRGE